LLLAQTTLELETKLVLRQLVPFYNQTTCRAAALITFQQVSRLMLYRKLTGAPITGKAVMTLDAKSFCAFVVLSNFKGERTSALPAVLTFAYVFRAASKGVSLIRRAY
jgi:hypothetical protein